MSRPEILTNYDTIDLARLHGEAARCANELPGSRFIEIGTRSGHSAMAVLYALAETQKVHWFFTVDPYGDKPYKDGSNDKNIYDYGEIHYRNAMASLSKFAFDHELLHYHWRMTSKDFRNLSESIEFWHEGEPHKPDYGFVFLDGEHDLESVTQEIAWFLPRMRAGAALIVDDVDRTKGLTADVLNGLLGTTWQIEGRKLYWRKV